MLYYCIIAYEQAQPDCVILFPHCTVASPKNIISSNNLASFKVYC